MERFATERGRQLGEAAKFTPEEMAWRERFAKERRRQLKLKSNEAPGNRLQRATAAASLHLHKSSERNHLHKDERFWQQLFSRQTGQLPPKRPSLSRYPAEHMLSARFREQSLHANTLPRPRMREPSMQSNRGQRPPRQKPLPQKTPPVPQQAPSLHSRYTAERLRPPPCGINQQLSEPIFVLGPSHSGTSIMRHLLALHPDVHNVATSLSGETYLWAWHAQDEIELWKQTTEWSLHCLEAGKLTWVEKTPRHILHVDAIRARFPHARIVLMARDPGDMVASRIRRWLPHWANMSRTAIITNKTSNVRRLRQQVFKEEMRGVAQYASASLHVSRFPPSVTKVVRLEDLQDDCLGVIRSVLHWLHLNQSGLSAHDCAAGAHGGSTGNNSHTVRDTSNLTQADFVTHEALRVHQMSQSVTGARSSRGAWRQELEQRELRKCRGNRLIASYMRSFGYNTSDDAILELERPMPDA